MTRRRTCFLAAALGGLLAIAAPDAAAQKNKKKEKEKAPEPSVVTPLITQSDNDQIDAAITQLLAGWQIGEIPLMQKYYAEDAVFISGGYEPPLAGWSNYLNSYQAQRQRMNTVTMNRFNTLIRVRGATATSNYQWEFSAFVDSKAMWARGHTTLVWEKRNGAWIITLNHTSLVDQGAPGAQPPAKPPAKP
jgi:ketosteroid isomerase-like protein